MLFRFALTNNSFRKKAQEIILNRKYKQLSNKLAVNANKRMEPFPRVFDILQYFETILPSEESLGSSQKDEVYFMDGGPGGL